LIFYSGIFWSAPDNNFGGYFLEIDPYTGVELVGTCAQ
jgi:hypothetical protein